MAVATATAPVADPTQDQTASTTTATTPSSTSAAPAAPTSSPSPAQDYSRLAEAWQGFSPERRKSLLGKMSPEQKKGLRQVLEKAIPATGTSGTSASSASFAAAPASLTANPRGEGLYRMGSYDEREGIPTKPEIAVPYSKITEAQAAGYRLHPDEEARYHKDQTHEGQGPTVLERAGKAVTGALQPEPTNPAAPARSDINNALRAAGRTLYATPGYVADVASAYRRSLETGNSNELLDLIDPTQLPKNLYDQYQQDAKTDPRLAKQNLVGSLLGLGAVAAVSHGAGKVQEAVGSALTERVGKVPEGVRKAAQNVVGAGERQVKTEVTKQAEAAHEAREQTLAANQKADEATLLARGKVDEANRAAQEKIDADNKAARLQAKSATAAAQREANAEEPFVEGDTVVTSARKAHDDLVDRQQKVEVKRTKLADSLERTRQAIAQRVQAINDAAKSYFKREFADVSKRLDAPDPETGKAHTISYATLDGDVDEAEGQFKGSRENVRLFEDIGKRAGGVQDKGEGGLKTGRTGKGARHAPTPRELEDLADDEREMLEKYGAAGEELPGAKYSDLDGYYQEAGRIIGNPATAPDVRQAVVKFREKLGQRMQKLAEEVDPDVAKKHSLLRRQYKEYARGFRDYTGPSESGSPIAKGLQAEDYYNATKPYQELKPAEAKRAKAILEGDSTKPETQFTDKQISGEPSYRYRKQTHKLIEHMHNLQTGLEELPSPEELRKEADKSAERLADARTKARDLASTRPEQKEFTPAEYPKPKPGKPVEVPEINTRELRDKFVTDKLRNWTTVNKFQIARLVAAPIGTVIAALTAHPSLEVTGLAWSAGELTPFVLQRLLDRPGVREWFTRPPTAELETLQKVPHADRVRIADGMRSMVKEAEREGKPLKLGPGVVTFIFANGSSRKRDGGQQDHREQSAQPTQAASQPTDFMVIPNPRGLIKPGNLPIWNRPVVQNADGTHSSEYSTSFEDEQGHEVLVPTIVNGKFLTPDGKKPPEGSAAEKAMFKAAWQHYLKTGEHLGIFDNADDADAYSSKLHSRGERPAAQPGVPQ